MSNFQSSTGTTNHWIPLCATTLVTLVGGLIYNKCARRGRGPKKSCKVQVVSKGTQRNLFEDKSNTNEDNFDQSKKLHISEEVIDGGSNLDTTVFEGIYDEREVAIKNFPNVSRYHAMFLNEIRHLRKADQHDNVVTCYGHDANQDYIYIVLERSLTSLEDLVLNNGVVGGEDFNLWSSKPGPSPQSSILVPSPKLLKIMRDVACGLGYFHDTLGVVHLHLEPKHVLIAKMERLCAKLSNLGFTTSVGERQSLFIDHGFEIRGWYHPDEREKQHYTQAMDLFSLGCIFFYCITRGMHPYGDQSDWDANIVSGKSDLSKLDKTPEAKHLIFQLLNLIPENRPRAVGVVRHPMFWDSHTLVKFLCDASNRFNDEKKGSTLLQDLESNQSDIWQGKWIHKLDRDFQTEINNARWSQGSQQNTVRSWYS